MPQGPVDTEGAAKQEDTWGCYMSDTEDGPFSNFVNLDVGESRRDGLTIRYLVRVKVIEPSPHGFPGKEEDKALWRLEDALEEFMCGQRHGRYVGRSTHGGLRIFCFYMREADCPNGAEVAKALVHFDDYPPHCSQELDAGWEFYFEFLYPSPEEMQCIQNELVVDNLIRNGDSLESARETDHWIFFADADDRNRYKEEVVKQGFKVREERVLEDGRYCLQIYRNDHVDYNSVNEVTLTLFRLAEDHQGDYDGWETFVVKDAGGE